MAVGLRLAMSASLTEYRSLRVVKGQAWEEQMKLRTAVQVLRQECAFLFLVDMPSHNS